MGEKLNDNPGFKKLVDKLSEVASRLGETALNTLMCDDECEKNKNTLLLKNIYDAEKTKVVTLPQDLSKAERDYIVYTDGQDVYNKTITDRFASTAEEYKQNSIKKQRAFMSDIAQSLKQYQAEKNMAVRAEELLAERQKEYERLNSLYNKYERIVQTNERKVVYQHKDMEWLFTSRRVMIFFYYAIIIAYLVYGDFFPKEQWRKLSVWIVLTLIAIIPYILNMMIKWVFIIKAYFSYLFSEIPHKDVYFDLDEEA
jgi:hypothetical protein